MSEILFNKTLREFRESIKALGSRGGRAESRLLFGQGLWTLFSGANTTLAFQSTGTFALPFWLERQWNPALPSFLPTGAGLLTCNLTARNWTSLGLPGYKNEIIVDPVGMVSPVASGPSFIPYIRFEEKLRLPTQEQHVSQSFDPKTRTVRSSFSRSECFQIDELVTVAPWEGDLCALIELRVTNRSTRTQAIEFGLAIRPYNTLSVSHIRSIERASHSCLDINGCLAAVTLSLPHSIYTGRRGSIDPLINKESDALEIGGSIQSKSGLLFANLEYRRELAPGATTLTRFVLPCASMPAALETVFARSLLDADFELRQESAAYEIMRYEKNSTRISIPESSIQRLFYLTKSHIPSFDDGDMFSPGSFLYHHPWLRDGYFMAQAALNMGLMLGFKAKAHAIINRQDPSGVFRNAPFEWDGNGQAIAILVEYCRKAADYNFLREIFPTIKRGAKWIFQQQNKEARKKQTHSGLLPMGFSAEHLGTVDSYFWDAMWGLQGIHDALWCAGALGLEEDVLEISKWSVSFASRLRHCIERSLRLSKESILPTSPNRLPDAASIGSLVACDPLALDDLLEPWIEPTLEFILKNHCHDNLFFHSVFHTGLNPYLSAQVARVLMIRGDEQWYKILKSLTAYASPTGTWPEAINPQTGGGCMGDGHHGWANAEYLNLLRNAFVLERGQRVFLGHGIPSEWLATRESFGIENAPTHYGILNFSVSWKDTTLVYSWSLEGAEKHPRHELFLSIPPGVQSMIETTTFGGRRQIPIETFGEFSIETERGIL